MIMKLSILFLLAATCAAVAQVPPFIRNPYDTSDTAAVDARVAAIAGTNTPITAPTLAGAALVADASKVSSELVLTSGTVNFSHASNGLAGIDRSFSIYLFNPFSTNGIITFPTVWSNNLWGCTLTNTLLSNRWTVCSFRVRSTTATLATQSNVWVRLEGQ